MGQVPSLLSFFVRMTPVAAYLLKLCFCVRAASAREKTGKWERLNILFMPRTLRSFGGVFPGLQRKVLWFRSPHPERQEVWLRLTMMGGVPCVTVSVICDRNRIKSPFSLDVITIADNDRSSCTTLMIQDCLFGLPLHFYIKFSEPRSPTLYRRKERKRRALLVEKGSSSTFISHDVVYNAS